jgi:two-component system phosphate regulon sensor histidine kinase PhoR
MDDYTLFSNAPIPMLILDLEGNIRQVNAAAQAFYGRSAEALLSMPLAALAYGENQHLQERAFRHVLRSQRSWEGLIDQLTSSGTRTVRLSLTPMRDAEGQPCNILACALDIHDLLNAQRILQHERDRLEAILESANDAVLMIDADGMVVTVNLPFEQLFNLPRHIVLERSLTDLVKQLRAQPELPPDFMNVLLNFNSDYTQSASYEFEISGTARRVIRWYSEPVHTYSGALLGRLFVFRDATHELALDRTKTEFVSLVTHELSTPLAAIKNAVEMLQDDPSSQLSEDGRQYVQIIAQRIELLETLVKDIIALTRIEAGRIELRRAYHPLSAALDEALNSVRGIIQARQQQLILEIPDDLPVLWIDRNRIAQVFTNLLTNASKYTHDGGTLLVRAARVDHVWNLPENSPADVRLPAVLVMVQDTGIGIAPEEQARIFERFYRAEDARRRRIQGSGLGLTIVASFVALHGGKVWLHSAPMQGSSFFFTLPIVEGQ